MTIGLQDPEEDRRRRRVFRVVKTLLGLALVAAVGAFSYQLGVEQVKTREASLKQRIGELEKRVDKLKARNRRLEGAVRTARSRVDALEAKLAEKLPSGTEKRLLAAIRAKLEAGLPAERLAFVIRNAAQAKNCKRLGDKRFLVSTPLRQYERNNAVGFGDGAVTITAEGQVARDAQGNPQSWFDPDKPVTAVFRPSDGKVQEVADGLPLRHNTVVAGREYRFVLRAGQRGFLRVAARRCPYP